jgi:hypothetical protein
VLARGAALLIAGTLAAAGCGSSDPGPGTRALERFDDFPVYFVGRSFEGLALRPYEQSLRGRTSRRESVALLYGDCEATDDRGCALPLEIESYPACARGPRSYSGPGASPDRRLRLRGVPAAAFGDDRLELYTRDTTIVVYADGDRSRMRRAASALRTVRGGIRAGEELPTPSRASLAGRGRC